MQKSPLVSVIIPMYNASKFIEKCIKSILNQDYPRFELILINDGSTDDTEMICKFYKNEDKRIRYFYRENSGVSSARNFGLKQILGKYVLFVDADDWCETTYISTLLEAISMNNSNLAICGYSICEENKNNIEVTYPYIYLTKKEYLREVIKDDGFKGMLWNKIFKSEIIKINSLKFTEEVLVSEDLLFCVQYAEYINNVNIVNSIVYNYRINNNGAVHSNFSLTTQEYLKKKSAIVVCQKLVASNLFEITERTYLSGCITYYCGTALLLYSSIVPQDELLWLKKLLKKNYSSLLIINNFKLIFKLCFGIFKYLPVRLTTLFSIIITKIIAN